MNSATAEPVGEKRPDVKMALDELESSVSILEDLVGALDVKLTPVCSAQEQAVGMAPEVVRSLCWVSANVRELDSRAYALTCRLRYLLDVLEV
jgi:hypothetical protein